MRISSRTIFCLVLALGYTAVAFGQGANTLQGKVVAPNGMQPNAPVKVTLTFSGRHIYETFTDLSGRFSFPGLARGTYQLTAEGDGKTFESTSVYAEVAAYGRGQQQFTQDIQLRPITREALARSGVVNAFVQTVPKAAQQAFERASQLRNEGKIDASLLKLQEAVQLFPAYFEAHLALGNHFLQAGVFDKAIAELDEARAVNPNDERLYQSFGLILMQQKNYPMAVVIFAEAARLNPNNPLNALMRATALIYQASNLDASLVDQANERKGLLKKAELALAQASDLSGNKLKADHMTMAMFYELNGEPLRAAGELEELLRKPPANANVEAIQKAIKRLRGDPANQSSPR